MQRFKLAIIVLCLTFPNSLRADELTSEQKLRAELFQAKITIAQLKAELQDRENKLASLNLTIEQQKLIEEFRKQLNANEKQEFDWISLTFKPIQSDKK